jgi:hypothetical protein
VTVLLDVFICNSVPRPFCRKFISTTGVKRNEISETNPVNYQASFFFHSLGGLRHGLSICGLERGNLLWVVSIQNLQGEFAMGREYTESTG